MKRWIVVLAALAGLSLAPGARAAVPDLGPPPVQGDCLTLFGTHETPKCYYGVGAMEFSNSPHILRVGETMTVNLTTGWDSFVSQNAGCCTRTVQRELGSGLEVVGQECKPVFYYSGSTSCTLRATAPTNGWTHHGYRLYIGGSYPYRAGDYYAVISEGFAISGTVMKRDTTQPGSPLVPAKQAPVTLTSATGGSASTTTNDNGAYTEIVEAGEWTVRAGGGSYCHVPIVDKQCKRTAKVTTGPDQTVNFEAAREIALSGTAENKFGIPIAGIPIRVRPSGSSTRLVKTGPDGKWSVRVPAGDVVVDSLDEQFCAKTQVTPPANPDECDKTHELTPAEDTDGLVFEQMQADLSVQLEALKLDGQRADGVVADQEILAKLTVENVGTAKLENFTFAGGKQLAIDARGTGKIVQTGEVPFPAGMTLAPDESKSAYFSVTTVKEGVAAAHTKVTAQTKSGSDVEASGSLLFRIANRQKVTEALGRYLVLKAADQFVFKYMRDFMAGAEKQGGVLRDGLVKALDPKQRRRWFGNEAGKLKISNADRARGFLLGVAPEMVAARLPNEPVGGFTPERMQREYDETLREQVGKGVAKWVKGYGDLRDGVQKALSESYSAALMNHHYAMGTATAEEREQVEAFYYEFGTGVEADSKTIFNTLKTEIPRWQENAGYAGEALRMAEETSGFKGFMKGVNFLRNAWDDQQKLRAATYEYASSDPLRFQRENAKLDAATFNAGFVPILDTLLGASVAKVAVAGKTLVVGGKGASVIEAGIASGALDDAGRVAKGGGKVVSSADEAVNGMSMQDAVRVEADGGLLANTEGATLVQASDHGNVYSLPNLGGVPETTLDAKASILKSIERDYATTFGKPAPKLVEILKTSSPLRKPGSVAKLELTAGKTGKSSMIDAGMPADALGEAVYWKSPTNPRKLPGFDDLAPARQEAAVKEWELANKRWQAYAHPKPGSKEAKMKMLIGQRGRVPLDDVPNKAGLQRFVIGEFEDVEVRSGDAVARMIRVKHYEIEVVDTTRQNLVVNRKTVIDNLEKAAPQTADADAVAVGKVVGTDPQTGAPIVAPLDRAEREFVMSRYVDKNIKARRSGAVPDLAEHGVTLVMEDASAKAAGYLLPQFGSVFMPEEIGRKYLQRIAPFVKPEGVSTEQMLEQMLGLVKSEGGFGQHAVAVTSDSRYLGEIPFERW